MQFDIGLEAVSEFDEVACYGRVWLLEFRDYQRQIVLENTAHDDEQGNFPIDEKEPA